MQGDGYYALSDANGVIWLPRDVTFMVEWRLERVSAGEFKIHARVSDADGSPLHQTAEFRNVTQGQSTLEQAVFPIEQGRRLGAGLAVGTNGPSAVVPADVLPMWYYGAVCVRREDWCGPRE
jgi:hypothetical protein